MLLFQSPLHCLRKTRWFRYLLNSPLNSARLFDIGYRHKIALFPLTHASIILRKRRIEPNIRILVQKTAKLMDEIKINGCFFDVGSNVGIYAWEVHEISPERKILAFEPDPSNFQLLEKTKYESNLSNVKLLPFALSNKSGEFPFQVDDITSATGTLEQDSIPWIKKYLNCSTKGILVQTLIMDNFLQSGEIPVLVKIDVEGYEFEVIEGGLKTISKHKPVMIIESFPPKQSKVLNKLIKIGYKVIDADNFNLIQSNTYNLFAWHPEGPIKSSKIENILT